MRISILLLLAAPAYAVNPSTVGIVANGLVIISNGETIVRSGFHPRMAWRKMRKSMGAAVKGQPKPVEPAPVPFPAHDASKGGKQ